MHIKSVVGMIEIELYDAVDKREFIRLYEIIELFVIIEIERSREK